MTLYPDCWPILLYFLIYCWFFLMYFSFQLLYSSALISSFSYFLFVYWGCHYIYPFLSSVIIFMTITLNFLSGKLFIPTSLSFLLRFCLILLFGTYSFLFSLCLNLYICFYVLGISATSPNLEGVVLYRLCPIAQKHNIPWSRDQELQGCTRCGLCAPSCCDWAMTTAGMLVGGTAPSLAGSLPSHDYCGCIGVWSWPLVQLAKRPSWLCCRCTGGQG